MTDAPQLDGLVIGGQQMVGAIGAAAPGNLVDALIDLQTLQIVKFSLV